MPGESADFLSLQVPEFGGIVVTSGEDELAIRGESDGADSVGVPGESADFLSLQVPEFGAFVSTSGEYELAIGGESDGVDSVGVPNQSFFQPGQFLLQQFCPFL